MSRIRNPRFAPEFLERRLSPSSFGVTTVMAEVQYATHVNTLMSRTETPRPTDADGDPIPPHIPAPGQTIPS